jgi:hypothetical protein
MGGKRRRDGLRHSCFYLFRCVTGCEAKNKAMRRYFLIAERGLPWDCCSYRCVVLTIRIYECEAKNRILALSLAHILWQYTEGFFRL